MEFPEQLWLSLDSWQCPLGLRAVEGVPKVPPNPNNSMISPPDPRSCLTNPILLPPGAGTHPGVVQNHGLDGILVGEHLDLHDVLHPVRQLHHLVDGPLVWEERGDSPAEEEVTVPGGSDTHSSTQGNRAGQSHPSQRDPSPSSPACAGISIPQVTPCPSHGPCRALAVSKPSMLENPNCCVWLFLCFSTSPLLCFSLILFLCFSLTPLLCFSQFLWQIHNPALVGPNPTPATHREPAALP